MVPSADVPDPRPGSYKIGTPIGVGKGNNEPNLRGTSLEKRRCTMTAWGVYCRWQKVPILEKGSKGGHRLMCTYQGVVLGSSHEKGVLQELDLSGKNPERRPTFQGCRKRKKPGRGPPTGEDDAICGTPRVKCEGCCRLVRRCLLVYHQSPLLTLKSQRKANRGVTSTRTGR